MYVFFNGRFQHIVSCIKVYSKIEQIVYKIELYSKGPEVDHAQLESLHLQKLILFVKVHIPNDVK